MADELKGKVAIVTGASSGIGQATALLFAKAGARVVVAGVLDNAGEETVGKIRSGGGEARYAHCDVSDPSHRREAWTARDDPGRGAGVLGEGIRINAVCPGFIVTPMLERAGFLADESVRRTIEGLHALKRLGRPEEVAQAVLFLSSPRASFITGHPLLVDDGYVAQ